MRARRGMHVNRVGAGGGLPALKSSLRDTRRGQVHNYAHLLFPCEPTLTKTFSKGHLRPQAVSAGHV